MTRSDAIDRAGRLTPSHPAWPARLSHLHDPPEHLFYRGDPALLAPAAVAIVGARNATRTGVEVARRLGRDLAAEGVVVVSGMARGIDAAAHRGALDAEGPTVAVLGSGLDVCYPEASRDLHERLPREGLLLSELDHDARPLPFHFPKRNRVIAALSRVVIVVEGTAKSGSRITADLALDLGREVAAVPRDPVVAGAEAPNALLRVGATPITGADDVLELLGRDRTAEPAGRVGPHIPERLGWLRAALDRHPAGVDEIVRASGRSLVEVLPGLVDLELRGVVERLELGRYRLTGG